MISNRSRAIFLLVNMITAFSLRSASSEILGPLLPKYAFEISSQLRWTHRDVTNSGTTMEIDQREVYLPIRYGFTEYATIAAELFVGDQDFHSIETDMRYYHLGGGAQALFWKNGDYILSGGVYRSKTFIRDTSGSKYDQTQETNIAIILLQRSLRKRNVDITIWGGPLLFYYSVIQESRARSSWREWRAMNQIGGTLGVNVLLFDHYQIYHNLILADYLQPTVGISYRF